MPSSSIWSNFSLIPSSQSSQCENLNALTRLVLVVVLVFYIYVFRGYVIALVIGIIIIVALFFFVGFRQCSSENDGNYGNSGCRECGDHGRRYGDYRGYGEYEENFSRDPHTHASRAHHSKSRDSGCKECGKLPQKSRPVPGEEVEIRDRSPISTESNGIVPLSSLKEVPQDSFGIVVFPSFLQGKNRESRRKWKQVVEIPSRTFQHFSDHSDRTDFEQDLDPAPD
jgi:hypothetical protein